MIYFIRQNSWQQIGECQAQAAITFLDRKKKWLLNQSDRLLLSTL